MPTFIRLTLILAVCLCAFASTSSVDAQNYGNDTRQEYVRSSSPTKSGARVISENVGGRKMVRIARAPGSSAAPDRANFKSEAEANRDAVANREAATNRESTTDSTYDYPDRADGEQVTAYRQAANQPPRLSFPQQNRLAQCNCNGVPVPPQQLQYPPQNYGYAGYQAQPNPNFQQQGFQPPPAGYGASGYGTPGQGSGYPIQAGIGVPQFNQTGGNWWTPFVSGSGYYTPLLNFRNMPQGTYLGQGIIGQPTAYVDGQPFRNLLRYVSP